MVLGQPGIAIARDEAYSSHKQNMYSNFVGHLPSQAVYPTWEHFVKGKATKLKNKRQELVTSFVQPNPVPLLTWPHQQGAGTP